MEIIDADYNVSLANNNKKDYLTFDKDAGGNSQISNKERAKLKEFIAKENMNMSKSMSEDEIGRFSSFLDRSINTHNDSMEEAYIKAVNNVRNPVKISFTDIKFQVEIPTTDKEKEETGAKTKPFEVLKNVTGFALPGQTTFIMGASGAGKTSLLNIISKRATMKPGQSMSGQVCLNDKEVN